MSEFDVILGPPGAGKTTYLLSIMEREIAAGVDPRRIGVLTFTKRGAAEAKERAALKFGLTDSDLPWTRTIHSLVFRRMGYRRKDVVGRGLLRELGDKLGVEFTGGVYTEEGMTSGLGLGDRLVFLENLARATDRSLREIWEESDHGLEWEDLDMFRRAYAEFKRRRGVVDYTDMLEQFAESGSAPSLEVLIVDEGQDLSRLQWRAVERLARSVRRAYVAGDDDQCIFAWAGADVEKFVEMATGERVTVLDQSYRISAAAHETATRVIRRVRHRRDKIFKPRAGSTGEVRDVSSLDDLDLTNGTWLLLARNSYMLDEMQQHCERIGVNYDAAGRTYERDRLINHIMIWERMRRGEVVGVDDALSIAIHFSDKSWTRQLRRRDSASLIGTDDLKSAGCRVVGNIWHEAMDQFPSEQRDRFLAMRARGERLLEPARVKISTIHGAKGGQADNVMLMTDVSLSAYETMSRDPDAETRCFYVGLTRSLGDLFIMSPRSNLFYEI